MKLYVSVVDGEFPAVYSSIMALSKGTNISYNKLHRCFGINSNKIYSEYGIKIYKVYLLRSRRGS